MKRKQEIMLVAARLFRQKSVLATTLDNIAAKVGINKTTIYSYFKGKKQLLYKITCAQDYIGSAQATPSRNASPRKKMESPIRAHLSIGTRPNSLNAASLFERKNLSARLPKQYNTQRESYEQMLRSDVVQEDRTFVRRAGRGWSLGICL
jgi:AcrR family transcriptional regulator